MENVQAVATDSPISGCPAADPVFSFVCDEINENCVRDVCLIKTIDELCLAPVCATPVGVYLTRTAPLSRSMALSGMATI